MPSALPVSNPTRSNPLARVDGRKKVIVMQNNATLELLSKLKTEMPELGISHQGQKGEGLFFVNAHPNGDPDRRTVHAGRPPTQGEKWVVSQFMRSRPLF